MGVKIESQLDRHRSHLVGGGMAGQPVGSCTGNPETNGAQVRSFEMLGQCPFSGDFGERGPANVSGTDEENGGRWHGSDESLGCSWRINHGLERRATQR